MKIKLFCSLILKAMELIDTNFLKLMSCYLLVYLGLLVVSIKSCKVNIPHVNFTTENLKHWCTTVFFRVLIYIHRKLTDASVYLLPTIWTFLTHEMRYMGKGKPWRKVWAYYNFNYVHITRYILMHWAHHIRYTHVP